MLGRGDLPVVDPVEVEAVGGEGVDGEAADDPGGFAEGLRGRGRGRGGGRRSGGRVCCAAVFCRCRVSVRLPALRYAAGRGVRVYLYLGGSAALLLVGARCW